MAIRASHAKGGTRAFAARQANIGDTQGALFANSRLRVLSFLLVLRRREVVGAHETIGGDAPFRI